MTAMTRACLALATALLLPISAPAEEAWGPHVTVTGTGRVAAAPDMATLRLGVVTRAPSPGEAVAEMSAAMAPVVAALTALGVAPADVQTGQLSLGPVYADRLPEGDVPPRIAGYEAVNEVSVRVRDLDRLGEVLDAAVSGGANRFDGLSFALADPEPVRDAALARAMADARDKAALLAGAAGVTLGPVLRIAETGGGGPAPLMEMRAADVPISPGEIESGADVSVTYALGD